MKRTFIISFVSLLFISNNLLATQTSASQKAWDALLSNQNTEARQSLQSASSEDASKAETLIGLCLLNNQEKKLPEAFNSFKSFYESSSNPYPYLYALSSLPFLWDINDENSTAKKDFYEKIIADPKMNGTLKAMLSERLGSYYEFHNNSKKANDWYKKMGAIDKWQVLGTFDNTSGSGFSKDWGVLNKVSSNEVFKNKVDADIQWHTPTCNKNNNWFSFDYYFVLDDAIMFAQSFVSSPTDQEVFLRIGTSGSLKVWVNDALVMSVPEERNCDLDIYPCKIKLNKGVNRVLVQIGQNEISGANFLLRLTDENANPISNLTCSTESTPYTKASDNNSNPTLLAFFAEEFFSKKIEEDPKNQLNYILLAQTYLRNDKAHEATKVLKTLEAMAPNSVLVTDLLSEAYLRAKNQTDYNKELEKIRQLDPNSYIALNSSYQDAVKSEKYSDADVVCKKIKELYGESPTTEEYDIELASYEKRFNDLISLTDMLSQKYPDRYDYMYIKYSIQKNSSKNGKAATKIVEDYCKKYYSNKALELLANIYFEEGSYDKAIGILKLRLEKMPYATGYMDDLMGILFKMQRYNDALAMSEKMLAMSPYSSGVYNSRGYIYQNLNDIEKAKENFKKAIYYNPTSFDSRTQLRQLEHKTDLNEMFTKNDLDKLIASAPSAKEYPQDNALVVLNDNRLIVYPEGAKEYKYEVAIKMLNQSAISVWKDYSIGYNSNIQKLIIDKAEIIKANGNKVKAETDNDNNVVFANLEVNDVIHLEYRIQDYSSNKMAKQFFNDFSFRHNIPSMVDRYSILAPKDKKFDYMVSHGDLKPKISDIEDLKLYEWEMNNQPAVKSEPFMSELSDIVPCLYYSSIPDWSYVSSWYKDITSNKFESDYVLKETAASILKGKENSSQLDKAKLFYEYILENITYSNVSFLQSNYIPQKASRTITTRLGDCKDVSTLFVALCREAGIDANLVLISTRNNGNVTMPLPSINFNHCIAQLNINNKIYYLELTNNTLPFGSAMSYDLNAEILPIPFSDGAPFGDKLIRMNMPFRLKNTINRTNTFAINGNDLQVQRKSTYSGAQASTIRDSYRYIGEEEQLKTVSEAVAGDFSVPSKVSNVTFSNLDNLTDSMTLGYLIDVKGALQDVANMKILKLPWTDKFSSIEFVNAETRQYPMEFWSAWSEDSNTEQINLTLPANKKFVEAPKDITLDCANASFKLTFKEKTPGVFVINRTFIRKSDLVTPEQYQAFRNFVHKVSEYDNKQYVIQ